MPWGCREVSSRRCRYFDVVGNDDPVAARSFGFVAARIGRANDVLELASLDDLFRRNGDDAEVIKVDNMPVGDSRHLFTDSGREVMIFRHEDRIEVEVDGKNMVIDCNIEVGYCHTGGMQMSVHAFCLSSRRAVARLFPDGRVEYRTDPDWFTPYQRRETVDWDLVQEAAE